ncbi:MAG: V4R domain-containing protein [Thermoplasmata archaeon]
MAEEDARFIKLRKSDIASVRNLQESVMHEAAPALQFRTGQALGSRIARAARPYKQQYFEMVRKILVDEGWVREIQFVNDTVFTIGSIETEKCDRTTCNMLRGLLSKIYEGYFGKVTHCTEIECESCGKTRCVFKMSFVDNRAPRPAQGNHAFPQPMSLHGLTRNGQSQTGLYYGQQRRAQG